MLVYRGSAEQFIQDVDENRIEQKIEDQMMRVLHKRPSSSERSSWMNSLPYMGRVLRNGQIPLDSGVAIEYGIPNSGKRVDFIVSGFDDDDNHNAVIVELKQWSEVHPIDAVEQLLLYNPETEITKIKTALGRGLQETAHPSYQVTSYRTFISDYNVNVQEIPITLASCAYLHNYRRTDGDDPLFRHYFAEILEESPLFLRDDQLKLQNFIKRYIKKGDQSEVLYRIEDSEIKPSKSLQDSLTLMLKGKQEFMLIDEQKIVYEKILSMSRRSHKDGKKRVFIVEGGPGTGKTVVAINLLVQLTSEDQLVSYVTKNSAPRNVFEAKLKSGKFKKKNISNLFKSSVAFTQSDENDFGTLIVDEAHRLNKRGQLGPRIVGEDQVKELIYSAKSTVFFLDEDQRVTAQDYGSRQTIKHWANHFGAEVIEGKLISQFRCGGSDGYLAWLDGVLGLQDETAHPTLEGVPYEFKVLDDPVELQRLIEEKNEEDNKSRLVAGYCWEWASKRDGLINDIEIGDFSMQWNLSSDATYAISEGSINQVGCIHTTQGLEFSYVGVIIGDDLRFENGEVITDFNKRAKSDKSLHGLIGPARKGDQQALSDIDIIIRNTYRTLMSRGMKGCFVYCTNKALAQFLKNRIGGYKVESPYWEVAERE
ncbi:MAG: DUF2075 domain-containing protein [Sphaerochaeta sp.]|jgi:DUF2075 family protein